jgi:hypothetical protein
MKNPVAALVLALFSCVAAPAASFAEDASQALDLSGAWSCALDPKGAGEAAGRGSGFTDGTPVRLPGTLDEAGIGFPNEDKSDQHLYKILAYEGAAWFEREIDVPADWAGKHVELFLERSKMTKVWVNGAYAGSSDLVYAHQSFDVTALLKSGQANCIVLCVNNDPTLVPVAGSHAYSPDTQTNWNGVIGKMQLEAKNPLHIASVRVTPDAANGELKVAVRFSQDVPEGSVLIVEVVPHLVMSCSRLPEHWNDINDSRQKLPEIKKGDAFETVVSIRDSIRLWNDENPIALDLRAYFVPAGATEQQSVDSSCLTTGLRDFRATPDGFTINARKVTLRGKHDACVFPLTAHPPMDKESWLSYFRIYKEWGLNHMRCHTWTPPEAAFEAADELGIYIECELPIWWGLDFKDPKQFDYMVKLGRAILDDYGNHPSFVMFALGNEISKDREDLKRMVDLLRAHDPRLLYAQGSNNRNWDPSYAEGDDYWSSFRTGAYQADSSTDARLSMSYLDSKGEGGILNERRPSTDFNFDKALERSPVPFSGFEVGQYQVFPNFSELPKYTGVLKPLNLEMYRGKLEKAGMLDQAQDFFSASGALSVICYRADIEAMLRTRRFAAFNLLDLQDYPGQGTALVGMLDAFMESKGLIQPEQWRQFCSDTVILAELPQYCWADTETFTAKVNLRNDGPRDFSASRILWKIAEDGVEERVLASGEVAIDAPAHSGLVRSTGTISVPLAGLAKAPAKLTLFLETDAGDVSTSYPLWVYPPAGKVAVPDDVIVAEKLTDAVAKALENGAHVLLLPKAEAVETHSVPMQFISEFWNWQMFTSLAEQFKGPKSPGTLGLLIDEKSPAFAQFPTSFHSDFQWWPVCENSRALILDDFPGYRPVAQAIDNIARDHRLGFISAFKVGKGAVLVMSCDLPSLAEKYPEARQLFASLLDYAASDKFVPCAETTVEKLRNLGL